MSLNIDSQDFYNLAWRGESIREAWLKLRILLRKATVRPEMILLEMNAPLISSGSTNNPFFFYEDNITSEDIAIARAGGTDIRSPLLTLTKSPYRKEIFRLGADFIKGRSLAPDPAALHFKILKNGFSYNLLPNRSFPGPAAPIPDNLKVSPVFDYFFRQIIAEAQQHDIEVVLISTPFFPTLRQAYVGPQAQQIREYINSVQREFGLRYFDFSAFSDDPSDYWNEDHLSLKGATRFGKLAGRRIFEDRDLLGESRKQ